MPHLIAISIIIGAGLFYRYIIQTAQPEPMTNEEWLKMTADPTIDIWNVEPEQNN